MSACDWPRPSGAPLGSAEIKRHPEDFVVEETLPFSLTGSGAHLVLEIRQSDWNTSSVARWLAKQFACRVRDVGFCGLKDKHAVTQQFFSVPVSPKTEVIAAELDWPPGLTLVSTAFHQSKLRRGIHSGNRFVVRIREIDAQRAQIEHRLRTIEMQGFPNYFARQRFGRDGANAGRGRVALREGRMRVSKDVSRSIEVSALRSLLFNEVLAARIRGGTWSDALPGDAMMLAGTRSFFSADPNDQSLDARIASGDVEVSGPLWGALGRGLSPLLIERERNWLAGYREDLELLETSRIAMARRPLRVRLGDLNWRWLDERTLELAFTLPPGSYATALVEEVFAIA